MKALLPLVYVVCIIILIGVPAVRVYRQTGINPIRTKNASSTHEYMTSLVRVLFLLPFISVIICSFLADYYTYLQPISYLQTDAFMIAGWGLLLASIAWIALAQYQMGTSWRVGIDDENKTELVAKGLYAISRNPIYVGIDVALLGLFLTLPDILTFSTMLAAYFLISVQVRLEEDFLLQQHGDAYRAYQQKVRRWL